MNETEIGKNIFYFFIGELGSLIFAFLLKEDKRLMFLVFAVGTAISGYIGFGRSEPVIDTDSSAIIESNLDDTFLPSNEQDTPTQAVVYTDPPTSNEMSKITIIGDGSVTSYFETAKALGDLAEEKYSLAERNRVNQTLKFTINLSHSQPVVWRWYWCATTRKILDQNLQYLDVSFILNDENISNQFFSTNFTFKDNPMKGWACFTYEAVLKDWTSGEYHLQQNATYAKEINDGQDTYEAGYKIYDYTLTVP